jgi:hypothetical protein
MKCKICIGFPFELQEEIDDFLKPDKDIISMSQSCNPSGKITVIIVWR